MRILKIKMVDAEVKAVFVTGLESLDLSVRAVQGAGHWIHVSDPYEAQRPEFLDQVAKKATENGLSCSIAEPETNGFLGLTKPTGFLGINPETVKTVPSVVGELCRIYFNSSYGSKLSYSVDAVFGKTDNGVILKYVGKEPMVKNSGYVPGGYKIPLSTTDVENAVQTEFEAKFGPIGSEIKLLGRTEIAMERKNSERFICEKHSFQRNGKNSDWMIFSNGDLLEENVSNG